MDYRLLCTGLLAGLCLACTQEETNVPASDEDVFYASLEQPVDPGTKVYADENLMILWHADDRVSIFDRYTFNQEYRFTGETGDNAGSFIAIPHEDFVTGNGLNETYAVYPYRESNKISNQCILTVALPSEQVYAWRSFGKDANTMVSATRDNNLLFKNLGGYLVIKLYGKGVSVTSLSLKGNRNEPLAGNALVTAPVDGIPALQMLVDSSSPEVTLTCPTPVTLGSSAEDYTEFWFVLPPTTFSEGFTVTVTGTQGDTFEKSTSKTLTIERNMLSRMAPINVELEGYPGQSIDPVSVSLNKTEISMAVGNRVQLNATVLPEDASERGVTWSSSDESIASVTTDGKVNAIKEGTCIIKASAVNGVYGICLVSVKPASGKENGYEWVDLGLSVKWATYNIGTSDPHGYGEYIAWGEIYQKYVYSWDSYKFWNPEANNDYTYALIKYCNKPQYGYMGFTDNKTVLEPTDDAATQRWKGAWRMPTSSEFAELINTKNCKWECTIENSVIGFRVTSKISGYTNQSIFLPFAGYMMEDGRHNEKQGCYYWTSSLDTSWAYQALYSYGPSTIVGMHRRFGLSIRPVID